MPRQLVDSRVAGRMPQLEQASNLTEKLKQEKEDLRRNLQFLNDVSAVRVCFCDVLRTTNTTDHPFFSFPPFCGAGRESAGAQHRSSVGGVTAQGQ